MNPQDQQPEQDQFTPTDPSVRTSAPTGEGEQIAHPGRTDDMRETPDHGEDSYRGTDRLVGRKALVTGGDSGIGRAVALAFAREGADVAIVYLDAEESDAKETAALVEDAGRRCVRIPGDIREESFCEKAVGTTVAELGGLDVLVNNAAYQMSQDGGLADITTEQLDRVMKTNVYAMFWLSKHALPHLAPGASIINTASVQGFTPSPNLLDYATSKAAIVNFTRGLGQQLARQGIRVNAVAPGPVWTPLIPATMDAEKVASFGEQSPMGRAAQPAELAPTYVFLASAESGFITSETVAVTGGTPVH